MSSSADLNAQVVKQVMSVMECVGEAWKHIFRIISTEASEGNESALNLEAWVFSIPLHSPHIAMLACIVLGMQYQG